MPKVDETQAQLAGATVFSKLNTNSGFCQIPLAAESHLLTTFITPFGRFCFNKFPFGISSAPELFQKWMSGILLGLDGVVCQIDDVLIFGANQEEHDSRLIAARERIERARVTLNAEKCQFSHSKIKLMGHIIDERGIQPDSEKISAIVDLDPPQNVTELHRFMGMVNQLGQRNI